MLKKVIYTCITGNYDTLGEPKEISKDFDYICFTDNLENCTNDGSVWQLRPLPPETEGLSNVKKQRYVKVCAHKVLPEYDISVWVDGNIVLKNDLNSFIDTLDFGVSDVFVPQHPQRNCTYKEAVAIIQLKKADKAVVDRQVEEYRKEGFPKDCGMLQSCILVRKHNAHDCVKLMENWWFEIKEKCHRDQLSFNYVAWKNQDIPVVYIPKTIFNSVWFKHVATHTKKRNLNIKKRSLNTNKHSLNAKKPLRIEENKVWICVPNEKQQIPSRFAIPRKNHPIRPSFIVHKKAVRSKRLW